MRKPMVAGNWKMHKTQEEGLALVRAIRAGLSSHGKVEVLVAPPFTAIQVVVGEVADTEIKVGGQNVYCENQGAFTGEISPVMLKAAGCSHAIIGHSERRHVFGETGDLLHRKVHAALNAGLDVIYCLGETLEEREGGQTEAVVERQLNEVLDGDVKPARMILAYEPVWAIGTGRNATPEQAQAVHAFLRAKTTGIWGPNAAGNLRILYGGSVKPDNAASLMICPDVDGALVGGACLKAESFLAIVGAAADSV
ncbi:MAG: triose-phosphate isomerase [Phycisphaerae bacterium]|nr:triose-phosphate isomerase [Phycisphaerae bacterium]